MRPHRLVVYGGGVSAWVTAATLVNAYSSDLVEVRLINNGDQTREPALADSGLASLRRFHASLRLSERDLMHQVSATFKVGVRFQNWSNARQNFIHGLGGYGNMLDGIDFHQFAILLQHCGDRSSFDAYSLAAQAANAGRFGFLGKELIERGFTLDYSLHVDLSRYIDYMQVYAKKKKLQVQEGVLAHLNFDDCNRIRSIVLASGEVVDGDFFFDCSGREAALIGQFDENNFIEWSSQLPVNKQLDLVVNSATCSMLTTGLSACSHGWLKSIPLRDKTAYSLTFNGSVISDDEAVATLMERTGGQLGEMVRSFAFVPGRRERFWQGNCVAIGAAAGECTNIALSYLHQVQSGILQFIDVYSTAGDNQFASVEYNQLTGAEYARILDYHQLHLLLCKSQPSDFWQLINSLPYSDELKHKLELFKACGKVAFSEYETWLPSAWISLLLGNNYWPEKIDSLLMGGDLGDIANRLNQMKLNYVDLVARFPDEHEFLNRYAAVN